FPRVVLLSPAWGTLPLAGWVIEQCMSRPLGTAVELERRRQRAVQAVAGGQPRAAVAAVLGVHPKTVARWVRLARPPGGLAAKPQPGPAPGLSDAQLRRP